MAEYIIAIIVAADGGAKVGQLVLFLLRILILRILILRVLFIRLLFVGTTAFLRPLLYGV